MFRVRWAEASLGELAREWTDADPSMRRLITAASREIDEKLLDDPETIGESRADDERIDFVAPLVYTFQVRPTERIVVVLHVRRLRRHRDG